MMTDEWMIDVISRRISEECPWSDAKKVLDHCHWQDVIEHLWKDKDLKVSLMKAYATEIMNSRAQELLSESDSLPL